MSAAPVVPQLWTDSSLSFLVPCSWECSVMSLSFASQCLWCLELKSYLDIQQLTPNYYQSPSLPFIWSCRSALHSSKLASTTWWKHLYSKDFQHSDTKTLAVGNEQHTEYNVIFIKYCIVLYNAKLLLKIVMHKLF
jgi:hypothetical protein